MLPSFAIDDVMGCVGAFSAYTYSIETAGFLTLVQYKWLELI